MEHFDRNVPTLHPFQEGIDGLLIVIGGETGAEPETKTPVGYLSGLAGEDGVFLKDFFRCGAVNYIPISC
jgi:hypothetical protein